MFRFTKLVQNLVTLGNHTAKERLESLGDISSKELTSIRLRPETKVYLQAQSESLGVSLSQVINMILDGVVSMETKSSAANKVKQIYDRIMSLFELHGINLVDMVKMLSTYNIKLSQIKNPDTFIDLVTIEMIKDIAKWFKVDYRWIIGETNKMYSSRDFCWYKNAYAFSIELAEMSYLYNNLKVFVVKKSGLEFSTAEKSDENDLRLDMGFLLSYDHTVNGIQFTRYEVCEFQRWNYEKCRGYLRFVFYFLDALRLNIKSYGVSLSENVINGLIDGTLIPVTIQRQLYESWYPYEQIGNIQYNYNIEQNPEEYLRRIDRLIALIGANSPIYSIKRETRDFAEGWLIKYKTSEGFNEEFYRGIGFGFEDVADKCLGK